MDDGWQAAPRPPRAPMPRRSRRRWAVAAGAAACWALLLAETGSVIAGTAVLLLLAALGACCVLGLRSVGVDADHPWVRRLAARPWRDAQDGHTHPHDGRTRTEVALARTVVTGLPTAAEPVTALVPPLTLVTAGCVTQTRVSGACAGRGAVELVLPDVPTVSREHARFTFADGQWWVANLGRNGLTLNGVPVQAGRVVLDGDLIRWGRAPDAPASRVGIG